MVEWMGQNSLVSRKFLGVRNIALYSVCKELMFFSRFWDKKGSNFKPLEVQEATSSHLKNEVVRKYIYIPLHFFVAKSMEGTLLDVSPLALGIEGQGDKKSTLYSF